MFVYIICLLYYLYSIIYLLFVCYSYTLLFTSLQTFCFPRGFLISSSSSSFTILPLFFPSSSLLPVLWHHWLSCSLPIYPLTCKVCPYVSLFFINFIISSFTTSLPLFLLFHNHFTLSPYIYIRQTPYSHKLELG